MDEWPSAVAPTTPASRPSLEARPLAAVIVVVTAGALPAFLTGAVSVQLRADLGFGEARLGLLVGVFFTAAALCSAVFGRAAERFGPTKSMRLAASASACSLLAIAAFARSWNALAALLAVAGAANALAQPAANVFIARTVPRSRLGLAFAVKQSGVPASTLLGGLAVPAIALTVGWRWAYVAAAAIAAVAGLFVPSVPPPVGGGDDLTEAMDPRAAVPTRDGAKPSMRVAVSYRPLVVLALAIGLGAAAAGTLGAFLTNAAVAAGISPGSAGYLVSGGSAIGIAMRVFAGVRADRRSGGHLREVTVMLILGAAAYGAYSSGVAWLLLAATPLAFGAGWGWPGLFNLAIVRENPDAPGLASGVTQTGTYVGAVLGPVAFGAIAQHWSYRSAWLVAAGSALAAAAAMWQGRAMIRRARVPTGFWRQ